MFTALINVASKYGLKKLYSDFVDS